MTAAGKVQLGIQCLVSQTQDHTTDGQDHTADVRNTPLCPPVPVPLKQSSSPDALVQPL